MRVCVSTVSSIVDVCCRRGATTLPLHLKCSRGWRLPPLSADLSSSRRIRYNISSLLLLTDDDDVKEEAREWALQQVVRAPAASSLARLRATDARRLQSPAIALVTRQGGGNLLFGSDVFIEDRVAAGVVGGEDVLVATAVDLMMARECEGRPAAASAF